jgi:hypothetical protein
VIVERYLETLVAHDWVAMGACVSKSVQRTGPFRDVYRGRDAYVEFLAGLMPTLPGYRMDVARVTYTSDGRRAFAELSETVEMDGLPTRTPEALVFELDDDGLIERIDIYIQTPERLAQEAAQEAGRESGRDAPGVP